MVLHARESDSERCGDGLTEHGTRAVGVGLKEQLHRQTTERGTRAVGVLVGLKEQLHRQTTFRAMNADQLPLHLHHSQFVGTRRRKRCRRRGFLYKLAKERREFVGVCDASSRASSNTYTCC